MHVEAQPFEPPSRLYAAALAAFVVTGYGSPVLAVLVAPLGAIHSVVAGVGAVAAIGAWIAGMVAVFRAVRRSGDRATRKAADVLALLLLPAWGLVYAFAFAKATCVDDQCGGSGPYRPFAASHIVGLIALHLVVSLAYAASRRRPEALRPLEELTLMSLFVVGTLVHAVIGVHFGPWLLAGFVFPPLFVPCVTPLVAAVLFGSELVRRLRLRGRDAALARMIDPQQAVYREGERTPLDALPVLHRPLLAKALAFSPVLMGIHFLLHALWYGRPLAAIEVFTKTCGYTLSQLPIEVVPGNCHYLCTVAARGHAWLVRPERLGVRRGTPILVNRQLAVANAFEDLLHERWPRFGRLARRVYDAVGLPISRYIRHKWLADAIYLAMKPAEWLFFAALLLLDRRAPEERIQRMYR